MRNALLGRAYWLRAWPPARRRRRTIPSYKDLKYPPLGEVKIPEIATFTLANGMKVYLLENHELPLVGGFALVRTGNLFDPPDKVGLAQITGTVMRTGGTRAKTGDQLDEQLENIAASVESSIGETSGTRQLQRAQGEHRTRCWRVFKDVLTGARVPAGQDRPGQDAASRHRSRAATTTPPGIASREFADLLYGRDTPYGWRIEYEHLDRIQRDDLVAFYQRYFFPANIMLAV